LNETSSSEVAGILRSTLAKSKGSLSFKVSQLAPFLFSIETGAQIGE